MLNTIEAGSNYDFKVIFEHFLEQIQILFKNEFRKLENTKRTKCIFRNSIFIAVPFFKKGFGRATTKPTGF